MTMFNRGAHDVFAIRVYDGVLSAAQLQYNHFIDLLAFYGVAIPAAYTPEDLATFAPGFVGTPFVYDNNGKGFDYDAVKASIEAAMAYDKEPTDYDAWYVTDGLVGLYTAFGDNISYNMGAGTWLNKAPNAAAGTDATFYSNSTAYSWAPGVLGNGGLALLGVTMANPQDASKQTGIRLPVEWAALENFTIETSQIAYGVNGSGVGGCEGKFMQIDLLHFHYVLNSAHPTEKLCGGGAWHGNTTNPWYSGGRDKTWRALIDYNGGVAAGDTLYVTKATTHKGEGEEATYTVTYGYSHNQNYSWYASDAVEAIAGGVYDQATYEQGIATERDLRLFSGIPADVYAIRVYNKALTTAEKQFNRLIDLLAFYQVAIPATATPELMAILAPGVYEYAFVTDNNGVNYDYDTVKADLNEVFEMMARLDADPAVNGLDDLYVQEGLVALYTAFDAEDESLLIPFGVWQNKIAGGEDAKLIDNSGSASFVIGEKGGLSISGITFDNYSGNAGKIAIALPDSLFGANYTVESAFAIYGLPFGNV